MSCGYMWQVRSRSAQSCLGSLLPIQIAWRKHQDTTLWKEHRHCHCNITNYTYQIVPGTCRGGSFERLNWAIQECFWDAEALSGWSCWSCQVHQRMSKRWLRCQWNDMRDFAHIHAQLNELTNEPMNQWINKAMTQRSNDSKKQWLNESTGQWTNELINQWVNDWMHE